MEKEETIEFNAKRLRSQREDHTGDGQMPSRYVTTLRDKVPGTPRRKVARRGCLRPDGNGILANETCGLDQGERRSGMPRRKMASRKSLRPGRSSVVPVSAPPTPQALGTPLIVDAIDEEHAKETEIDEHLHLEVLEEEADDKIEKDPVQPKEGPLAEDVDEALKSPTFCRLMEDETKAFLPVPIACEGMNSSEQQDLIADDIDEELKELNSSMESTTEQLPQGFGPEEVSSEEELRGQDVAEGVLTEVSTRSTEAQPTDIGGILTTTAAELSSELHSKSSIDPAHIGTSALHKETLPTLEDDHMENDVTSTVHATTTADVDESEMAEPTEQANTEIDFTEPAKAQKDQDTASTKSTSTSESHSLDFNMRRSSRRLSSKKKDAATSDGPAATGTTSMAISSAVDEEAADGSSAGAMSTRPEADQEMVSGIQAADELPVHNEDLVNEQQGGVLEDEIGNAEVVMAADPLVEQNPAELEALPANQDEPQPPGISVSDARENEQTRTKTRSGTRFSDDTTILKDFLSRAQAKKLAKDAAPKTDLPAPTSSPRRSSRKAPANPDGSSPTRLPRDLANRPGTPPDEVRLEEMQLEENAETAPEASPVRRSTRKRLPGPTKTATGAPSFIPVRRADGTDPVKLQKSVAQELALVTQTNTRRNKGQSKPPAMILKTLTLEHYEEATKGGHALRNCKSVGWDKKLVYYQDGTEAIVEVESKPEEKRPKARRLRGLGAGNGTPAPKRTTADVLKSNGTPSSKRHGRTR